VIGSPAEIADAELRALLEQLSLDEKVRLMTRVELPTPWEVPRIGLRPLPLSDGPAGVRPQGVGDVPYLSPCETALAANWDPVALHDLTVEPTSGVGAKVAVTVRNTSERAGKVFVGRSNQDLALRGRINV
jgi:hypothetical protein